MCYIHRKATALLAAVPVLLNIACTAAVYYCFWTGFITRIRQESAYIWAFCGLLHLLLLLTAGSLILCLATDPGTIPLSFPARLLDPALCQRKQSHWLSHDFASAQVTFCPTCQTHRPARAHHCRVCNRCILRYDHHCPWIGSCIGLHNHRYFLQYLVYLSLALLLMGGLSFSETSNPMAVLVTAFGLGGGTGLAGFTLSQLLLVVRNWTTLEANTRDFNVYDQSCWENWKQVCGGEVVCWLLPCPGKPECDGLTYPLSLRLKSGGSVTLEDRLLLHPLLP